MIRNGDLILGWMPRAWMEKRRAYYNRINAEIRESINTQTVAAGAMKNGSGSKFINPYGDVRTYTGPVED